MFKEQVRTALNSAAANDYFSRIDGDSLSWPDRTFIATARALVYKRLPENAALHLSYSNYGFSKSRAESKGEDAPSFVYADTVDFTDYIDIMNFNSANPEDNKAWMDAIERYFLAKHPDYHRVEKVTVFFKKQFNVLCYVCPECRNTALFTDNLDVRRYHYLQCAIPAFLPWYFNKEQGVSEEERELIDSLREKSPAHYLSCIERFAANTDMRAGFIRQNLEKFEAAFEQQEISKAQEEIENINNNIARLNSQISEQIRNLRQKNAYLSGLESAAASQANSELMDYFLVNKKLELIGTSGTHLRFYVSDSLMYFDDEAANNLIENDRSYMYRPGGSDMDAYIKHEDAKRLWRAIFVEKRLRIRCGVAIDFRIDGGVSAVGTNTRPFSYDYANKKDATPNPHLYHHNCFGGYAPTINELIKNRNYLAAIEQCIASVKSLNVLESLTMSPFMRTLYTNAELNRCVELPNGSIVTPKEAAAFLKKEEQENGKADQTDAE